MIAGLTAAVCLCACVCVLCMPRPCTHTCTGVHMCTHHPGNETVCLPCITNHTQVWQAMKRLSTFNMQLEFFFFSKATHCPPQPPLCPTIRLFVWLKAMWNVRPHLSSSVCYEEPDWTWVLQGVHERWVMDVWSQYFFQKYILCAAVPNKQQWWLYR